QKYLTIEEINKENYNILNSIIDVSREKFYVLSDGVHFSATLTLNDTNYLMQIKEGSKYIVHTKSGQIYEYDMFINKLYYSQKANTLGTDKMSGDLVEIVFKDVHEISDIEYVKITDVALYESGSDLIPIEVLELELYSK
ncbi:MAG: hypothetical protein J6J07_06565, partial [Oscillospiraceae bacterium]|nr:hypothetical protein [Oscillospiraceae bacterium]